MNSLLIIADDTPAYLDELQERPLTNLDILPAESAEEAASFVGQADIILGQPDLVAPLLPLALKLKWVQSTFAGVEPLCAPGMRRDYMLTGVKQLFGPLMSEYVMAYILARERQIIATHQNQRNHFWNPLPYRGLQEVTIGIIGLGSIGSYLARTARSFEMKVLGMKRTPGAVSAVDRIFLPDERADFLSKLDYLILVLPDTPETRHFIRLNDLRLMQQSAVLINVGRGSSIHQESLILALKENVISGAILDVFDDEPLPADSPLWDLENVIITPHNAALSFPRQITDLFCRNYSRYLEGVPLEFQIDFQRGY